MDAAVTRRGSADAAKYPSPNCGDKRNPCALSTRVSPRWASQRESIDPPRNVLVLSVKRRIARAEGKAIYEMADLFTDMTADNARPADFLVDDTCGSSEENPILIVQPECRPGVYNRPVLMSHCAQHPTRTTTGINTPTLAGCPLHWVTLFTLMACFGSRVYTA
jgi:hypothetical protein